MKKLIEIQPVHKYFYRWVNNWGDLDKHNFKTQEERLAYEQAMSDIFNLITCPNAYPLNDEIDDEYYHE